MAPPHSCTLAWKIPWMEEQSDTTERLHFHFSVSCIGEGNGNPLQCSCLENPRDWGPWWAAIYGVAQSRTRLKRLSSSSRLNLIFNMVFWESFVTGWIFLSGALLWFKIWCLPVRAWPIFYNKYKWSITFKNCESLYSTPITCRIFYINYTLIKYKTQIKF